MALLHAVIEQGVAPLTDPKGTQLDDLRKGHIMTGLGTWREGAISAFDRAIFSYFRRAGQQDASQGLQQEEDGTAAAMKVRGPLKAAKHINDAVKVVCEGLRAKISSLSMIPVGDISVENPLSDYGMDSLVAVEMRNWIARELDATVPVLELMANEPMHTLSGKVVAKSRLVNLSELD
jgi:acyl carrier protein